MNKIFIYIICSFVFISFLTLQDGGGNAASRFATVKALVRENSFKINHFYTETNDWAKNQNGDYYSNKAPGGALFAYPFYLLLEKGFKIEDDSIKANVVSIMTQALPFLIFTILLLYLIQKLNISKSAQIFLLMSVLFANTASLLINVYMGHTLAAGLVLGFIYFTYKNNWKLSGFLMAVAVCAEYSTLFLLPAVLAYTYLIEKNEFKERILNLLVGASMPLIFFFSYHYFVFGGVFTLPHTQVTDVMEYVDSTQKGHLSSILHFVPNFWILHQLIWSLNRGILFTQPWLLFILLWIPFKGFKVIRGFGFQKALMAFSFFGFLGVYYMNACFPGWHGGSSPGPRYLSVIFPVIGVFSALVYDLLSVRMQKFLWILLCISLVFRALVAGASVLPPMDGFLWSWYLDQLIEGTFSHGLVKFFVTLILILMTFYLNHYFKDRTSRATP